MSTLIVERIFESTYNQTTLLKDDKGRVKKIINGYVNQPKKNSKQYTLNGVVYALDWKNIK